MQPPLPALWSSHKQPLLRYYSLLHRLAKHSTASIICASRSPDGQRGGFCSPWRLDPGLNPEGLLYSVLKLGVIVLKAPDEAGDKLVHILRDLKAHLPTYHAVHDLLHPRSKFLEALFHLLKAEQVYIFEFYTECRDNQLTAADLNA